MSAAKAKGGIGGILKRGWTHLPDIVAGSGLAIVGLVLTGIGLQQYYSRDGDNRRYKIGWVVMRPDDPRADKVHED